MVKSPEQLGRLKQNLHNHYKMIKETYKHLAPLSGAEIYSVGVNALVEFLN